MTLLPLDDKAIFLKTHILVQRDNPSKLVSEFVRAFISRLNQVGLYQPDLQPSRNGHARNGLNPAASVDSASLPFPVREVA